MANLIHKLKFPLLVAFLLTLVVVLAIEKDFSWGIPILLVAYFVFMVTLIYKEKGDGT